MNQIRRSALTRAFAFGVLTAGVTVAGAAPCASTAAVSGEIACSGAGASSLLGFFGTQDVVFESSASYVQSGQGGYDAIDESPTRRRIDVYGSVRATESNLADYFGATAAVSSAASLFNGTLRAFGTSADSNAPAIFDAFSSTALLRDQITVSFAKSMSSVTFDVSMAVDGAISGSSGDSTRVAAEFVALVGDNVLGGGSMLHTTNGSFADFLSDDVTLGQQVDMGDHWEATFDLLAELFVFSDMPNGTADFNNTAAVRLRLPDGVTFRSSSGVFLSAVAPPIPEPETWALMAFGLGALQLATRRRRCGAATCP